MPCIVTSSHVWISLAEHANSNQRCHSPPQQLQTILPQCNNLGAGRSCCLLQRKVSQDQAAPGHQQGHHQGSSSMVTAGASWWHTSKGGDSKACRAGRGWGNLCEGRKHRSFRESSCINRDAWVQTCLPHGPSHWCDAVGTLLQPQASLSRN